MKNNVSIGEVAAVSLQVATFALIAYRAHSQPIAHDEALTFTWFLDGSVYRILMFNGNNHVLFTLMSKCFLKVFGVTELSLRAPSLIGAAAYLLFVFLLCRKLLGNGLVLFATVAMLSLNPQIMDFMLAARGYGLGMAALVVAMYYFAKITDRGWFESNGGQVSTNVYAVSIGLSLSVAANLTNLIPALATGIVVYVFAVLDNRKSGIRRRTYRVFLQHFVVPGSVLVLLILWPFLIQARPANFRFGLKTLSDALRDLFQSSFLYKWTGDTYAPSLGASAPLPGSWQETISTWGAFVFLPIVFTFVLFGVFLEFRRGRTPRYCLSFGGSAIVSVIFIALLHVFLKANYPVSRTALPLVFLFTIGGVLCAKQVQLTYSSVFLKTLGFLLASMVIGTYLLSIHVNYFRYNDYDRISRSLFQAIRDDGQSRGLATAQIGGTWWYQPEVDFYRRRFKTNWLGPYDIKDPSSDWQTPNTPEPRAYDYFIFTEANDPRLPEDQFHIIFQDKSIGVTAVARRVTRWPL